MKALFFILSFLYVVNYAFGQADTSYTDTVIIEKPPVIIKQKVHVQAPSVKPPEEGNWAVGVYYLLGQTNFSTEGTVQWKGRRFQNGGIEVKRKLGPLEVGTGLNWLTTSFTQTEQQKYNYVITENSVIRDTLDCYTIIDNKGMRTICQTEERIVREEKLKTDSVSIASKHTFQFIQIPLSLSFTFYSYKFYLTPSLQLIYGLKIKGGSEMKSNLWSWAGQVSLGYRITAHLSGEVKFQIQQNLGTPFKESGYQNPMKLNGVGLGLQYRF